MNSKVTPSSVPNEKTTIYLDPRIKKAAQYYALRDASSLSQIINEKLFEFLEDQADIAALTVAHAEEGDFVSLDQVITELALDPDEIRSQAEAERAKTA
jgi:predicted transcriptional regulator